MGSTATHTTPDGSNVTINLQSDATRIYNIIGTFLLCGSVGMLAYAAVQQGWIEIAATLITSFLFQFTRLLFANGLLKIPEAGENTEFRETRTMLQTVIAEYKQWQSRSPMWRLTMLAIAYAILFLVARWIMLHVVAVVTNIWVAAALMCLLAMVIIAPNLIAEFVRKLTKKKYGVFHHGNNEADQPRTYSY